MVNVTTKTKITQEYKTHPVYWMRRYGMLWTKPHFWIWLIRLLPHGIFLPQVKSRRILQCKTFNYFNETMKQYKSSHNSINWNHSFTWIWSSKVACNKIKILPWLFILVKWLPKTNENEFFSWKKKKNLMSASVMPDHASVSHHPNPDFDPLQYLRCWCDQLPVLRLGLNSRLVRGGGKASRAVCAGRARYRGGVNSSPPEKLLRTPPVMGRLDKLTGFFPIGIFLSKYQVKLK